MGNETGLSLKMTAPSFTFHGEDAKKLVTLHPDGRVEIGEGLSLDDATLAFWKGVEAAGFQRLNAELESLRASLESAGAWLERWGEHVGNCRGRASCSCGLTAIRAEVQACLSRADGT